MRLRYRTPLLSLGTTLLLTGSGLAVAAVPPQAVAAKQSAFARLPLHFEPNVGQTDPEVRFLSRGSGYSLFLLPTESVLVLSKKGTCGDVIRLQIEGSSPSPQTVALDELPGRSSYFHGADSRAWVTSVPHHSRVELRSVYPGIDLAYHSSRARELEYDFIVAPGADPATIRLHIEGARSLKLDAAGNLVMATKAGDVVQQAPVLYQEIAGRRTEVCGRYALLGGDKIGFEVESYDATEPLVIDPILRFSTYFGGTLADTVNAIAVDPSGNVYVAGVTASSDFPTLTPAQPANGGGSDAFVAKLLKNGQLVYSTYLGGLGEDIALGIAADGAGSAYVAGATSGGFPTTGLLQPIFGGGDLDAFLSKLNPAGSALVYSTYLGGTGDEGAFDVALNAANEAHVAGTTSSLNYPVLGAVQPTPGDAGAGDGFITRVNAAGSGLVWSTYFGGESIDFLLALAVGPSGAAVTGFTASTNLPLINAIQGQSSAVDAFAAKLNPAGNAIVYSTYLGGTGTDAGLGIALDPSGNAYLTGVTDSVDFPTFNSFQANNAGLNDAFVVKLGPVMPSIVYSSYLGGTGEEYGIGIAVSTLGKAYVTGYTNSLDFPLVNPIPPTMVTLGMATSESRTSPAPDGVAPVDDQDAFVTNVSAAGNELHYSTLLGGCLDDAGLAIAVDARENAFVGGSTGSLDFPVANAFQPIMGGGDADGFIARLSVPVAIQDFNGNLRSDILWRHTNGSVYAWLMNGTTIAQQGALGIVATAWKIVGNPDLNGDGKADILWRHSSGIVYAWIMDGLNVSAQGTLRVVDNVWVIVGHGDFDGDGKGDIVFRNANTGEVYIWFMNGLAVAAERSMSIVPDLKWQIVGAGDYDGDGVDDIFWRHSTAGANYMWILSPIHGAFVGFPLTTVPDTGWRIARSGDFNGDGRADILWRHVSAGALYIWFMDGTAFVEEMVAANVPDQGWQVFSAGDLTGEGKADILWRHLLTGTPHLWRMNGAIIEFATNLPPVPDTGWQIQKTTP